MKNYTEEEIKYLEEIEKKYYELRDAVVSAQHKINTNDDTSERHIKGTIDNDELYERCSNAKMEIFELWHLAYTGRKYGEE